MFNNQMEQETPEINQEVINESLKTYRLAKDKGYWEVFSQQSGVSPDKNDPITIMRYAEFVCSLSSFDFTTLTGEIAMHLDNPGYEAFYVKYQYEFDYIIDRLNILRNTTQEKVRIIHEMAGDRDILDSARKMFNLIGKVILMMNDIYDEFDKMADYMLMNQIALDVLSDIQTGHKEFNDLLAMFDKAIA